MGKLRSRILNGISFPLNRRHSINRDLLAYGARFEGSWGDWLVSLPRISPVLASKARVQEIPSCHRQTRTCGHHWPDFSAARWEDKQDGKWKFLPRRGDWASLQLKAAPHKK